MFQDFVMLYCTSHPSVLSVILKAFKTLLQFQNAAINGVPQSLCSYRLLLNSSSPCGAFGCANQKWQAFTEIPIAAIAERAAARDTPHRSNFDILFTAQQSFHFKNSSILLGSAGWQNVIVQTLLLAIDNAALTKTKIIAAKKVLFSLLFTFFIFILQKQSDFFCHHTRCGNNNTA